MNERAVELGTVEVTIWFLGLDMRFEHWNCERGLSELKTNPLREQLRAEGGAG